MLSDCKALEKLPLHVWLLVAEEEAQFTDITNLVVWCMALGISYVSVFDNEGVFRRNISRPMEEIVKQQKELLGSESCKYSSAEFLSKGTGTQEQVSWCQTVVKVLSPDDGKLGIVRAAQQLCKAVEQKESMSKDINVTVLDSTARVKELSRPRVGAEVWPSREHARLPALAHQTNRFHPFTFP